MVDGNLRRASAGKRQAEQPCSASTADGICRRSSYSRGLCRLHYERRRRGTPCGSKIKAVRGAGLAFLLANVEHSDHECLTWPFGRTYKGYAQTGRTSVNGVQTDNACRLMCALAHGAPPSPSHQAAHSCGNGHLGCVNPRHLRWATPKENSADMILHGTSGRRNPVVVSNLSADQIRAIFADARPAKVISKEFGVPCKCVDAIRQGRSWRSVTGAQKPITYREFLALVSAFKAFLAA